MPRPDVRVDVRVVHRDAALLVLDKPTGLPTTVPDESDSLVQRAAELDPSAPALHPTSRLDAEVTGLVTFARTREANAALLAARRAGAYRRFYLGIAEGAPELEGGAWAERIALDPRDPRKRRVVPAGTDAPGARQAETEYEVVARAGPAVLLALRPRTGRTHQLRVHAAAAGCPLLGDVHYDGSRRATLPDGRVVTARRVMLHCHRLELPDVARGEGTLWLVSEVPDDFQRVWTALGGGTIARG